MARIYGMDRIPQRVSQTLERLGLAACGRSSWRAVFPAAGSSVWPLAACMLHQPRLLLLDEPTAGVDPKARRDFWEEIHNLAARGDDGAGFDPLYG